MAASSGGIPRLLYSESVNQPLLLNETKQYDSTPGATSVSKGSSAQSRARNFTTALGYVDHREDGASKLQQEPSGASPVVDESGTVISPRDVVHRSTEIPG